MSLKVFHLLFIAVSVVLAAFMAAWSVNQYRAAPETGYLVACALSVAGAVALAVYGTKFQRKMRRL